MIRRLIILGTLLCFVPILVSAQGFRIGDNAPVSSSLTAPGVISTLPATINVCNSPANAVPCTNKATTFTSVTLGTPCATSTQVVLAGTSICVAGTDNRGNWGAWVAAGNYDFTITVTGGNSFGPFTLSAGIPPGSSISPGTVNGQTICDGVKFPTLNAAIAAASTPGTIVIPLGAVCPVTANLTVPVNVVLQFYSPSLVAVSNAVTLTFAGPGIIAGPYQIFSYTGTGTVSFLNPPYPYYAHWFPGADIGVQSNNAYAALPVTASCPPCTNGGGIINVVSGVFNYSTPINFSTQNKGAALQGEGPGSTVLNYTATTGCALTNDWGATNNASLSSMGNGFSMLRLEGTGTGNSATAYCLGKVNPLMEGHWISRFTIDDFGTAIFINGSGTGASAFANSFAQKFDHGNIYNVNQITNISFGVENLAFDHIIFQPSFSSVETNCIVVSSITDAYFRNDSFDNCQLVVNMPNPGQGNVTVEDGHFEDLNNTTAEFVVVTGGMVSIFDTGFYFDPPTGSIMPQFINCNTLAHCSMQGNVYQNTQGFTSTIANSPTGATEAVNTVTITTTATCAFVTNQWVNISGVGVSGYNGDFQVLTPGCNGGSTFTYTNPTSGLAASGSGTVKSETKALSCTNGARCMDVSARLFGGSFPLQPWNYDASVNSQFNFMPTEVAQWVLEPTSAIKIPGSRLGAGGAALQIGNNRTYSGTGTAGDQTVLIGMDASNITRIASQDTAIICLDSSFGNGQICENGGTFSRYNSTSTGGQGVAWIPCNVTSQRSETAADANLLTCTIPAAVGTYRLRIAGSISAASAATLGWTATWTDSNGNAATPTNLPVCLASTGTCGATTGAVSASDRFSGDFEVDVNNAGTSIVLKLTFSGTSFTAKVSASVERLI